MAAGTRRAGGGPSVVQRMAAYLTPEEERAARRTLREMVASALEEARGRHTIGDMAGRAAELLVHFHPEVAGLVLRDEVRRLARRRLREAGRRGIGD
jgi:hypothetical protein